MKKSLSIKEKFSLAFYNHKKNNLKIAASLYSEILKINSNHSHSHRALSRLIKYVTNDDGHFKELIKIYKKINVNDLVNKSNISFALGKAYEDIKDFDKSFTFYNEANKTYRKIIKYSMKHAKIHGN